MHNIATTRMFTMKNKYQKYSSYPINAKGFTLVEVLVSVIILAIGLLGAATLIMYGLQTGQGASQRSIAVVITQSFADKLRLNKQFATTNPNGHSGSYYYSKFDDVIKDGCLVNVSGSITSSPDPVCNKCSDTVNCTNEELAKKDMLDIYDMLNSNMPSARLFIERQKFNVPAGGSSSNTTENKNIYCIAISWDEKGLGKKSATEANTLVDNTDPNHNKPCGQDLFDGHAAFYQTWVQL